MSHTDQPCCTDNWPQIKAKSEAALPRAIVEYIEQCRAKEHAESQLISVLHKLQGTVGYIGKEQIDAVAQLLGVPAAKVSGVATFYHFFSLEERGKFLISVCLGTACYVKGAQQVLEKFKEELGIESGETTKDGMFSLQVSRCLGTCGLAPVVMINEEVHAKVAPDNVAALLKMCQDKA
ncbi:MAG: NAD(P)-dependent iron-only hydrogenase diaphorase iron-sulfur protein [Planctomycetes bacterium GWF2_50_10]|nr:MAG: NAD(P)-dependent iron-only hydrogenase diaphorase iron-sulfur protein [Planctomycetes bacterium GWF2_50_10]